MEFGEIRAVALRFPGVVETTSHGTPALKVGTKLLARMREEPGLLALRCVGMDERDLLIEAEPGIFFITDHFRGYPYVLARMERLEPERFAALFEAAWRAHALKRHLKAAGKG